ncbi:hypothetical protein B0J12DRAFT_685278 [Macrophomina phaseolina]|uniref:Uncharacterized protein n=1 Tax=Macrophomina phaseolina TaxID=35725 RepID=A0ABQ8FTR3_9PEZI|nr:hypothetical protein B0J12DRAFT_685278 [Macrophomina phaseolina]
MPETHHFTDVSTAVNAEDISGSYIDYEWSLLIADMEEMRLATQPQEDRRVATPDSFIDNSSDLDPSTACMDGWSEGSLTPIANSPASVYMIPDYVTYPEDLRAELLNIYGYLPALERSRPTQQGIWPEYYKHTPKHEIVLGLKVWIVDGHIWYKKRTINAPAEGNDSWSDYLISDSALLKAGDRPNDGPLLLFLIDRDEVDLWEVLMGSVPPRLGRWFIHLPSFL